MFLRSSHLEIGYSMFRFHVTSWKWRRSYSRVVSGIKRDNVGRSTKEVFQGKKNGCFRVHVARSFTVKDGRTVISSRNQVYLERPESQTKGNRMAISVAMLTMKALLICDCIQNTKCVSGTLTVSWTRIQMDPKAKETSSPDKDSSMA